MANPYTDPRYQMARLMRDQRRTPAAASIELGPAPSKAAVTLGRTASDLSARNPNLRSAIEAIAAGKSGPAQPKGVMGAVLGNPLTKAVLAPLELLAIPGRATVATLRETIDAIDGNENTKASFQDFRTNMKDKTYGFGKAFDIDTGSKWLDRGIGFIGDLALDPLTYATFGAGKFAGYAGRLDLSKAVLRHTGDEALANAVQRFGRAAIKDKSILEAVGANRHGVYFLGKRVKPGKPIRLPGSGAIGYLGDNALARLRVSAMGTKGGRWLQKMTLPSDNLAARQALLQGKVGNKAAATVISFLTAAPIARTTAGEVAQREGVLLNDFLTREGTLGLEGYKDEVFKYLENPELLATASPEMQRAASEWQQVFEWYEKQVDEAIQATDPTHEFAPRAGYYPRMQTDEAIRYRSDAANPYSRTLNEIHARDPLEGGGNFKSRTLQVGDDWFGHTLTAGDLKSTEKLNELARPHLGGANYFETDITKVTARYVDEFSKEMGLLARHKHLADTGFWKRAEEVSVTGEFIDKELIDSIKLQVKSLTDEMADLHKATGDAALALTQALTDRRNQLQQQLDELTSVTGALGAREELGSLADALERVLRGSMTLTSDNMKLIGDKISSLRSKFAAIYGLEVSGRKIVMEGTEVTAEDAPHILHGLDSYFSDLERDFMKLADDAAAAEIDEVGEALALRAETAAQRAAVLTERLKEAEAKVKEIIEFGNQLESSVDKVLSGATIGTDEVSNAVHAVLAVSGATGELSNSATSQIIAEALGRAGGTTQQLVGELIKEQGGLYRRLTQLTAVSSDVVKKMSVERFNDMLPRIFTGELSMSQVREMGLWALLHDDVLMPNPPEALSRLRAELIEALEAADSAEAMTRSMNKSANARGRSTTRKIWENIFEQAERRSRESREAIDQGGRFLDAEGKDILEQAAVNPGLLNQEIDEALAKVIINKYPFLGKFLNVSESRFDEIEELMGATYMVEAKGMPRPVAADVRNTGSGVTTIGELINFVKGAVDEGTSFLDDTISYGTGVGRREMTFRQVLEISDRVKALRAQIKGRAAEIDSQYKMEYARGKARLRPDQQADPRELAVVRENARARAETIVARRVEGRKGTSLSDMRSELKQLLGGDVELHQAFMGATRSVSRDELAQSVYQYAMVSEVIRRFQTVTVQLAPYGIVPTERHFSVITRNVAAKFIPILEAQMSSLTVAEVAVRKVDRAIAAAVSSNAGDRTISEVFRDAMDSLTPQEKEAVVEAFGRRFQWGADPYELMRGRVQAMKGKHGKVIVEGKEINASVHAENEYLEKFVRPWFEAAFPDRTPTKTAMKDALKLATGNTRARSAKSALITPWGESASVNDVKRFFEEILGDSSIPGRSSKRIGTARMGGNMGGDKMYTMVVIDQTSDLATKRRRFRQLHKIYKSMMSPDADMKMFLDDPTMVQKTPTFYASVLRGQIEDMAGRVVAAGDIQDVIAKTAADQADAAAQAAARTGAAAGMRAGVIPENMAKSIDAAVAKVEAYRAWETASAELQAVREEIAKYPTRNATATTKKKLNALRKKRDALQAKVGKTAPEKPNAKEVELASMGSAKAPRRAKGELGPKKPSPASEAARKVLSTYTEKTSGPEWAAAESDRVVTEAMESLAGYDLWRYSEGFTLDGEVYAAMPDGTRIIFTQDEWESLFFAAGSPEQLRAAQFQIGQEYNEARAAVRSAQRRVDAARQANRAAVWRQSSSVWMQAYGRGAWGAAKKKIDDAVEQSRLAISEAESELSRLVEQARILKVRSDAAMPETRAAAIMKFKFLVEGTETSPAIFDAAGLARFQSFDMPFQMSYASSNKALGMPGVRATQPRFRTMNALEQLDNPNMAAQARSENFLNAQKGPQLNVNIREFNEGTVVVANSEASRRRFVLRAQWQQSDSHKLLQEVEELKKNITVLRYKQYLDEAAGMQAEAERLQSRLDDHLAAYNEAQAEIAVQRQQAQATVGDAQNALEKLGITFAPESTLESVDDLTKAAAGIEASVAGLSARPATAVAGANEQLLNARELVDVRRASVEGMQAEEALAREARVVAERAQNDAMDRFNEMGPKARVRLRDTEQVLEALKDVESDVRVRMAVLSGTPEQFWAELADQRIVANNIRTQIDEINNLLNTKPPKEIMDILKKMSKGRKGSDEVARNAMESFKVWRSEAETIYRALADGPDDPVVRAFAASSMADGELIALELEHGYRLAQLATASVPTMRTVVIEPLAEGYERAAREAGLLAGTSPLKGDPRMLGLRGDSEAVELLQNIARINQPGVVGDMARFMRGYTGFFRSYATLSPGFHVRNSISNVFSMFAGGAEIKNMREGFRLWRLMDDHIGRGGTLDSWVASLPAEQQEYARKAARIVLGLGGGKTEDALEGFVRSGVGVLRDNRAIRTSRKVGHKAEGSARFMMAYDSLVKGMDENVAFNRTRRYMIDYNEKTLLDETMRDIIPFWTWMSRNLPLQIVNRWANPKPYIFYQRAYNNFNQEDRNTPAWLRKEQAINLGGGKYLNPDLPFTGINEQIQGLTNPQQLMGYVNPGLRVPLEMMAGKSFFSGQELDGYVPLQGKMKALLPVFAASGSVEYNSKGEPMVRKKAMYAVMNTVPFLQRMDKLFPSANADDAKMQNAVNTFLGVPVREVNQGMVDSEKYRRLAELQALMEKRKQLG